VLEIRGFAQWSGAIDWITPRDQEREVIALIMEYMDRRAGRDAYSCR
jgi:hypothetical protein